MEHWSLCDLPTMFVDQSFPVQIDRYSTVEYGQKQVEADMDICGD